MNNSSASPGAGARAFVLLQYLLPQHLLSRGVYWLTRSRAPWLKNALIRAFLRGFRPDMSDALQPDALSFASFNDFFTRRLRADARPPQGGARSILSPVDGAVSEAGAITGDRILQAKGRDYTLQELLAGDAALCAQLQGGSFATIYLAPFNYHRIHMPLAGRLRDAWLVPGALFSVNGVTAARVPRLFARNERLVCVFDSPAGPFVMVLVGALFVGSMNTVWHGEVTPRRGPRRVTPLTPSAGAPDLAQPRGAELGLFNMGSTVVLLLPPGMGRWQPELQSGRVLRVGELLGELLPAQA
jgi:phosphatidylserine decarboxylase